MKPTEQIGLNMNVWWHMEGERRGDTVVEEPKIERRGKK